MTQALVSGKANSLVEPVGNPVTRSTVVEKVATALVEYISASQLVAGNRLPSEASLAKMFGVSRLALREALIRLKALGLIEARHGAGWFLRKYEPADSFRQLSPLLRHFTGTDIHQIMQVRKILEPEISRIAAEHLSKDGLRRLRTTVAGMEEHLHDREKFIEWDMSFHSTLAEECGNAILAVLCAVLTDLSRSTQWAYRDSIENRRHSLSYHERVLAAIFERDGPAAHRAMLEHIETVWERVETEGLS
jgi:GntR family transcriptional regulator, transcriptional repressor for pyruvate dehydrogenase complex